MKVEMKWTRWLVCAALALAFCFYRRWDTLSLVIFGIIIFTGTIRVWVAVSAPGFEQRVAKMKPEQRELFLANLPEFERERWRERLKKIDAGVDN
ncbi:MAG: hypothetical protein AAB370_00390 [Verrucomicrobiota bacterium]